MDGSSPVLVLQRQGFRGEERQDLVQMSVLGGGMDGGFALMILQAQQVGGEEREDLGQEALKGGCMNRGVVLVVRQTQQFGRKQRQDLIQVSALGGVMDWSGLAPFHLGFCAQQFGGEQRQDLSQAAFKGGCMNRGGGLLVRQTQKFGRQQRLAAAKDKYSEPAGKCFIQQLLAFRGCQLVPQAGAGVAITM